MRLEIFAIHAEIIDRMLRPYMPKLSIKIFAIHVKMIDRMLRGLAKI